MDLNKLLDGEPLQSAVMVLHELATDSLILTKRSNELRHHPGEICFPGGKQETGDESLYATALRELYEELGITAARIMPIRKLQIERTLLGTTIHPWLASIDSIRPYHQNPQEVATLIFIPMSLVINPQNYREIVVERDGLRFKSCEFIPNDELVWGATARIMKQLTV
ncbi:NUDIX hydrolase [Legionella maioricensis]|uniref:CoA pyrophosphatase n=1 Tax=Legionella maioricensis TaxID=2896528 RepID=A0A9X2D246_9GAMM|nr:CoA pyrophosphatase [Legionella maioricensis]MCL9685033.1 CoA pyrophosphatase [Legionella maioricensis]MCL9688070.1 CoA pyrophosphatase [Legionella maioricensis]